MTSMYILRTDDRPTVRPRILENFERPYLGNGLPIHFMFGSTVGFSWLADRMALHPLDQIQDRGRQPSCIILNGHISETVHPIQFLFDSRVNV